MCVAYYKERRTDAGAWAEAQRTSGMFDRNVRLARPVPEDAAEKPAAGVVRVEGQCAINQCDHSADVLAEISQRIGGIRKDTRVVSGHLQGPSCEISALPAVSLGILAP